MRAISLWQPWASLWCSPAKVHETRHWSTDYRGPLLVHAAKRKCERDVSRELDAILCKHFGPGWPAELPLGMIVGRVELVDCVPTESMLKDHFETDDVHCGDFSPGRFAWRRSTFELYTVPLPWKGRQGFFDMPDRDVP